MSRGVEEGGQAAQQAHGREPRGHEAGDDPLSGRQGRHLWNKKQGGPQLMPLTAGPTPGTDPSKQEVSLGWPHCEGKEMNETCLSSPRWSDDGDLLTSLDAEADGAKGKSVGCSPGVDVAAISQCQHGLGGRQQARSSGGRLDSVVVLGLRADVARCTVEGQDLLAFGGLWAEL
jgi:hypothetical protein